MVNRDISGIKGLRITDREKLLLYKPVPVLATSRFHLLPVLLGLGCVSVWVKGRMLAIPKQFSPFF